MRTVQSNGMPATRPGIQYLLTHPFTRLTLTHLLVLQLDDHVGVWLDARDVVLSRVQVVRDAGQLVHYLPEVLLQLVDNDVLVLFHVVQVLLVVLDHLLGLGQRLLSGGEAGMARGQLRFHASCNVLLSGNGRIASSNSVLQPTNLGVGIGHVVCGR